MAGYNISNNHKFDYGSNNSYNHANFGNNNYGNQGAFRSKSPIVTEEKSHSNGTEEVCCQVCQIPKAKLEVVYDREESTGEVIHPELGQQLMIVIGDTGSGKGMISHSMLEKTRYYQIRKQFLDQFGHDGLVAFDTDMALHASCLGFSPNLLSVSELLVCKCGFRLDALSLMWNEKEDVNTLYHYNKHDYDRSVTEWVAKKLDPSKVKLEVRSRYWAINGMTGDLNISHDIFRSKDFNDAAPYLNGVLRYNGSDYSNDDRLFVKGYKSGILEPFVSDLNNLWDCVCNDKQIEYAPVTDNNGYSKLYFDVLYEHYDYMLKNSKNNGNDDSKSKNSSFMTGY